MSIATDEARKESYRRCLEGCVAPAQFSFQDGYVAGRTAEPTEAEIEAADEALLQAYRENSNMLTNREAVHIVLDAALKAVTGDDRGY